MPTANHQPIRQLLTRGLRLRHRNIGARPEYDSRAVLAVSRGQLLSACRAAMHM